MILSVPLGRKKNAVFEILEVVLQVLSRAINIIWSDFFCSKDVSNEYHQGRKRIGMIFEIAMGDSM